MDSYLTLIVCKWLLVSWALVMQEHAYSHPDHVHKPVNATKQGLSLSSSYHHLPLSSESPISSPEDPTSWIRSHHSHLLNLIPELSSSSESLSHYSILWLLPRHTHDLHRSVPTPGQTLLLQSPLIKREGGDIQMHSGALKFE
ncbi:hypothetical protein B0H17DRAFT_387209 [Mycena rosella]|uniref:Uncharacterized protein n=1 Tax=Mycena rosella TaxID=1033263 RepID=A0AAD7CN07_MYCRO|nr:hypothetical protein B0H17DRAFT_387209 [Mycena rosella]